MTDYNGIKYRQILPIYMYSPMFNKHKLNQRTEGTEGLTIKPFDKEANPLTHSGPSR